ncbi:hypothetical protein [Coxiella burnetii]|uniref:hypothetical protein n=1 Tax=Coxiella burnetii TaxID=777 RepID=UPI0002D664AD|nr:hypothetical protein [Coxiella burnetii]
MIRNLPILILGALIGLLQGALVYYQSDAVSLYLYSSLLLLIYTLSFNQKHLLRHLITSFLAAGLAFIIIYWPYTGSSGKSLSLINFALVFYVIHAFHMAIHEENKLKSVIPVYFTRCGTALVFSLSACCFWESRGRCWQPPVRYFL